MAAAETMEVPVPPQYEPQPLVDFRFQVGSPGLKSICMQAPAGAPCSLCAGQAGRCSTHVRCPGLGGIAWGSPGRAQ